MRPARIGLIGILGALAVGWGLCTADRVAVWQSDATLWAATLATAPTPRAWVNYGVTAEEGDATEALLAYRQAVRLAGPPPYRWADAITVAVALNNQGALLGRRPGGCPAARDLVAQAVATYPTTAVGPYGAAAENLRRLTRRCPAPSS